MPDSEPRTTMQAVLNGAVVAESDDTVVVEGNHYFPRASVRDEYLTPTDTTSVCWWKGTAAYETVAVGDEEAVDGLWYYPEPKPEAAHIADRVAFWNGVVVVPVS